MRLSTGVKALEATWILESVLRVELEITGKSDFTYAYLPAGAGDAQAKTVNQAADLTSGVGYPVARTRR